MLLIPEFLFASRIEDDVHRVGIRLAPPFVMQDDQGQYHGLTITLWEHIAEELELEFIYEERDIQGLLNGVSDHNGSPLFASASALTITAEREQFVDFTHPFFVSGLGIAVAYKPEGLYQALKAIFTFEFIWIIALLILLLLFWGVLVWFFERKTNSEEFGGDATKGIGSGFWWAAVTMTTVGYGDKTPRSFWGRTVGFIWMFAGIFLVSFFTASIASSLTVSRLDSRVNGPQDLPHIRVGALEASATTLYLDEMRIRYRAFSTIEEGLSAVTTDDIDAFVHDAPIIKYLANEQFYQQARVLPHVFNEQYYGIAIPLDSPRRNEINQVILEFIAGEEWKNLRRRYLGN